MTVGELRAALADAPGFADVEIVIGADRGAGFGATYETCGATSAREEKIKVEPKAFVHTSVFYIVPAERLAKEESE